MIRLGCKSVAENVMEKVANETELFISEGNRAPSLAVVLVGSDPASMTYVRKKKEACEKLGFLHFQYNFDEDAAEGDVLALLDELNGRDDVDGILVQLPPKGILEILRYFSVDTAGKKVVVIGRSNIVGKPMAALLMQKGLDATVTVCNTKTPDLRKETEDADIVIVATGHPDTIDSSYVKNDAVVIDVGVNRIADVSREKGFRLTGDADYASFENTDVKITPVPGGVGLMTVSMLMMNTLEAAKRRRG